ncbi:MAG: ATP-dependent DNA helicase RecG [Pseudomonadota bacterium]|nr:ATP-dependent DNA helicase RecG [Pseudomonadota bacterium]
MSARPKILFPLFAEVTALTGVGPRIGKLIERLAGPRVVDLLWHLPSGLIDRRFAPKIAEAPDGRVATITVTIDGHEPPTVKRRPYKVRCSDDSGDMVLVFFHGREDYLTKTLPIGQKRVVSGRVEHFSGDIQMVHPDHMAPLSQLASLQTLEPVYPLTEGLTPKPLGWAIAASLKRAPALEEWVDKGYLAQQKWRGWRDALGAVHAPDNEAALEADNPDRQRLAFDELLANQLAIALVRAHQKRAAGRPLHGDGGLRAKVTEALPFAFTASQTQAIDEIAADMAGELRMMRLLQGDVGSGKTVVALFAMLAAVEAGTQAALMAPTEILARQHLEVLTPLAEAAGLRVGLLTGRDKGKARDAVLHGLASGDIDIAIGTHALFQKGVEFRDLGLAVIDEQHRFGVHQRLTLGSKSDAAHMLVMTATPIPRTLMLTAYGDMDASRLTEKPAGRQPIDTRTLPLGRLDDVVDGVARAIAQGARVYWVCPLVDESEAVDLAAATERHMALRLRFGDRVRLIHGQMKGTDKDAAMAAFAAGDIDILVATTVIEVGVDVAEATVMVIEHAERFGLAQLHQLRGRIGRGAAASTCLLLYAQPLGETARARLNILRETDDGFRIAEEDLRLRGAGEVLGTRQSGLPAFHMADLAIHGELLAAARDDARLILGRDDRLETPRGQALRTLLYLFERDAAVKYLRSG